MNHGLINKTYYSSKLTNKDEIYNIYPELERFEKYFSNTKKRDRYLVAFRYEAVKRAKRIYPEIVLTELAKIINVDNHASVYYYLNKYIPLDGHEEFIKENFDKCMDNNLYPLTPTIKAQQQKGLFNNTFIENGNLEYCTKINKEKTKRKYEYQVLRDN